MNLEQLKAFLESAEGKTDEVLRYLGSLFPTTLKQVQQFAETPEGKSWLDSLKDKHLQKGLETWKQNNLEGLIDTEIKKRFPEKDPKDIEVERLRSEITAMQGKQARETLTQAAMKRAGDKGLPLELAGFFVGADEAATEANLQAFEDCWNTSVQRGLEARLKTDGYVPPKGDNPPASLENMSMGEYIKARQKNNGGNS